MYNTKTRRNTFDLEQKYAVMVVPTGIGASIGGYAGDASLVAREVAQNIPLIVNPNIVNAAVFSGITENMLYVEGWSLNEFVRGNLGLIPSSNNKIGVIFDRTIPENVLNIHINTINAVKTVYGIDIIGYEITEKPVGIEFFTTENDISSGVVNHPETMLNAGQKLLNRGADVLAVVCYFQEPPEDEYENGEGVDVVGGVEAVVSHYLSRELFCPCVHAPAFADVSITGNIVSPKCSAEYITPTFLPCLMFGLTNAPLLSKNFDSAITKENIHSLLMPYDSLGSGIVFDSLRSNIPVYAIKENTSVLNVDKNALGLKDVNELETYRDFIRLLK